MALKIYEALNRRPIVPFLIVPSKLLLRSRIFTRECNHWDLHDWTEDSLNERLQWK